MNEEGVGVILNLLDQVHGLRRALADILQATRKQSTQPDASLPGGQGRITIGGGYFQTYICCC